jgi:hypothetical protein
MHAPAMARLSHTASRSGMRAFNRASKAGLATSGSASEFASNLSRNTNGSVSPFTETSPTCTGLMKECLAVLLSVSCNEILLTRDG